MITAKEQLKIILKGAQSCVSEDELLSKLESGRPLVIKLGLDPSAPDIHLGHAVVLRKIKQMQDLGHRAVIVIGDFTGRIGDPTGKAKGRAALSDETVRANAATYCEQIFKVLDRERTEVRFNSEWLATLNFEDILKLAATTTVARILERDDFQNRYKNQAPIGLHEFFYPLMQAYDSLELNADIELGGSDQTFNVLMGRTLQKSQGKEAQVALFMPLLEGLDGVEKMSKSLGNYIGVSEAPEVMFKKLMEIPDALIIKYWNLATDIHPDEVARIEARLSSGENPRDIKYELAMNVTELYHGKAEMEKAREYYDAAFAQNAIPENIPELAAGSGLLSGIAASLIAAGFVQSKSELVRLVNQGGVQLNGERISGMDAIIKSGDVLKLGKKRFVRLI